MKDLLLRGTYGTYFHLYQLLVAIGARGATGGGGGALTPPGPNDYPLKTKMGDPW